MYQILECKAYDAVRMELLELIADDVPRKVLEQFNYLEWNEPLRKLSPLEIPKTSSKACQQSI